MGRQTPLLDAPPRPRIRRWRPEDRLVLAVVEHRVASQHRRGVGDEHRHRVDSLAQQTGRLHREDSVEAVGVVVRVRRLPVCPQQLLSMRVWWKSKQVSSTTQ